MKKKIVFLLIIILILCGGFFYWWWERETPPEKWGTAKNSPREDYVVKETPEGRVVENTEVGLSFEIPEEWIIKETPSFLPDFTFHSPNTKFNDEMRTAYLDVLEEGCRINLRVEYIKTEFNTLARVIKEEFSKLVLTKKIDKYENIEVNNYLALKHTFSAENLEMYYITVHLPTKNKVYIITLGAPLQEREQCEIEFNKFLETVSIE